MAYFLGACSLALALVFLGTACNEGAGRCKWGAECPCDDGTTQEVGCDVSAADCTEACSGHGGVNVNVNFNDASDGGAGG